MTILEQIDFELLAKRFGQNQKISFTNLYIAVQYQLGKSDGYVPIMPVEGDPMSKITQEAASIMKSPLCIKILYRYDNFLNHIVAFFALGFLLF